MVSSLFGLPVGVASAWIFNCYVIEAGNGLVLVDPGLPIVADRAIELVQSGFDRRPSDIVAVACTHGHPDHVGGVSTIARQSSAPIHLPDRCRAYLGGETPRTFPLVESSVRFMAVYREQPFSFEAVREFAKLGRSIGFGGPPELTLDFEPSGYLEDGSPLPGAPGWRIIHAPGHTDDSTCFYHADTATLISGDAVVTQDHRAWFNPEYVDLTVAEETEERLRSLEVRRLLPGHGRPIEAADVWATARRPTDGPTGRGLLASCSRRFGRWAR